ncbi:MAG: FxsA family protein [Gammaproteobacteria bacterium]|nr:FxsA family protein [Gammaproteobacteria bacterium]
MLSSRYTLWILLGLPLLELYLIAKLATVFGFVSVLLWVIVSGTIGLRILQSRSWSIWSRVQQAVAAGQSPGRELLDSAFVIAAGVLLIVPGFITDGLALLCLVPQSRAWIARSLESRYAGMRRSPGDDGPRTIDGEYRREE